MSKTPEIKAAKLELVGQPQTLRVLCGETHVGTLADLVELGDKVGLSKADCRTTARDIQERTRELLPK
jgi:hypothetical protein